MTIESKPSLESALKQCAKPDCCETENLVKIPIRITAHGRPIRTSLMYVCLKHSTFNDFFDIKENKKWYEMDDGGEFHEVPAGKELSASKAKLN